ncbi:Argininosuccinate lyase [Dissostichus eleginoides]|uniref:Argininosuccinate lyase n=1 Tax=Dissostichus eleginoides TaxID=100907 RepID=A0AAD9BLJ2_DISEL|nr:Argininosuccinate lyase [Dissostichus eleginoides]
MLWISCMLIGYITCRPIQQEAAAAPRFMHWPPPSNYGYWGRGASSDPGSSSHLPGVPVPRSNKAPELPALQEASSSAVPGNYKAPDFYRSPNIAVVKDDYASLRDERYNSPVVREPEVAYAEYRYDTSAPENNVGSYYNLKDASWMVGRYNNPQVSEPEVAYAGNGYNGNAQVVGYGSSASTEVGGGLSSEPAGEEEPEPVFSEVAGLEPVFSEVAGLEPVFSEVAGLEPVYSFSSRSRYQRERSQVAHTRYIPGEPVPRPMPLPRRNSNPRDSAAANAPSKVVF